MSIANSVALGSMVDFIRGVTYKPSEVTIADDPGAVACLRTKNIQEFLEDDDLVYIPRKNIKEVKIVQEGDVLVSSANSWNLVGKCSWVPKLQYEATFGGFTSILRVNSANLNSRYLYHWFSSSMIQDLVRSFGQKTTNISNLNQNRVLNLEVPLPPLSEQKRIAAILDKADQLRQKRKQAIVLLDSLTQSIFLEMFGRLEIVSRLEDICIRITDGTHQAPTWADAGIPFLFVSNIRNQLISFETNKFVSKEEYHRLTKNCPIDPGDVLYTTVGSYGNAAVVPIDKTFIFQRHIAQIKPNLSQVSPIYLSAALECDQVRQQADRFARGVAQKTVTLTSLRDFTIPFPSMEQQRLYEHRNLKVRSLLLSQKMEELDSLFASLQHRAFSGQL